MQIGFQFLEIEDFHLSFRRIPQSSQAEEVEPLAGLLGRGRGLAAGGSRHLRHGARIGRIAPWRSERRCPARPGPRRRRSESSSPPAASTPSVALFAVDVAVARVEPVGHHFQMAAPVPGGKK